MRIMTTSDLSYVSGGADGEPSQRGVDSAISACTWLGNSLYAVSSFFGFSAGKTLSSEVTNSCTTAVNNWSALVNKSPNAIAAGEQ